MFQENNNNCTYIYTEIYLNDFISSLDFPDRLCNYKQVTTIIKNVYNMADNNYEDFYINME